MWAIVEVHWLTLNNKKLDADDKRKIRKIAKPIFTCVSIYLFRFQLVSVCSANLTHIFYLSIKQRSQCRHRHSNIRNSDVSNWQRRRQPGKQAGIVHAHLFVCVFV